MKFDIRKKFLKYIEVTQVSLEPEIINGHFLFAYAILLSIPNKLGGVISLAISIAILFIIPTNKSKFRIVKCLK